MLRRLLPICLFAATWLVDAAEVLAQTAWPDWQGSFDPPQFPRGAGGYFSVAKIVASFVVFWLWLAMADWVNRDSLRLKLSYRFWNTLLFGSFFAAFLLMWIIPWFALGYTLLLLAAIAPPTTYVVLRNKTLHDVDKAFTLDHIKHVLGGMVGIKTTGKKSKESESPLKLSPRGTTTPQDEQTRLIAARQLKGFVSAGNLIHRAIQKRASAVMVDFTPEAAAVKFQIDGVWLDAEVQPRQLADPLLASLKALCGLKPEERRARQSGLFLAIDEAAKLKLPAKLTSQGTKTGERAVLQFDDPQLRKRRLSDLGLRQKLQDDLQEVLKQTKGLIVLASAPGHGLTTLTTVCLSAVDRYTRTVMAVEDVRNQDVEVENVPVTTYDSLEQETPLTKLPGVIRQFPDVLVVPDFTDADTLKLLCSDAREERLVITTVRAKDTAEALVRPLVTKVSPKSYALATTAVVASKLVRKLCEKCREAYPPPPQILQRLGIAPEKVPAFYRPPTQPRQEVCPECGGLGYKGLAMLVELLLVTDPLRQQLVQQPNVDALRTAARKAGLKTFEDEGLLLVVKGITSVPELARVLKEPAAPPSQVAT